MRSTGKIHLGNYFGAIRQHIALQDEGECFYFIADYHALTTDYADTTALKCRPSPVTSARAPGIPASIRSFSSCGVVLTPLA